MKTLLQLVLLLATASAWGAPGLPYFARSLTALSGGDYFPALTNDLDYYWGMEGTNENNYVTGTVPTLGGTTSLTEGVISNGISCPVSSGGSAQVPDTYWTNQDWTCCGWFKISTWANNDVLMGQYLPGNNVWFVIEDAAAGAIKILWWDKNDVSVLQTRTIQVDVWNFFAIGYSPTNNVCWAQVNGDQRTTSTLGEQLKFVGQPFECGGHFTGAEDEVGIWGRTLSVADVCWLYNNGQGRSFSDLPVPYNAIDVSCLALAPFIAAQPQSVACLTNTVQTFSVSATNVNGSPVFQWRTNNVNLTDGGKWFGTTTSNLWITNDAVLYTNLAVQCVVSNSYWSGSVTSSVAYLNTMADAITNGLLAWWKLDDGGGAVATNVFASGSANLTNSPAWVSGKFGGGLEMNGGNYAIVPASTSTFAAAVTMTAWVKFSQLTNAFSSVFNRLGTYSFQLLCKSDGKLYSGVYAAGAVNYNGGAITLVTNNWYNIVMTYSSSSGLNTYVNNALDGSVAANGALTVESVQFDIGMDDGTPGRILNGIIDDVRIYNRVLNTNEIGHLYYWAP